MDPKGNFKAPQGATHWYMVNGLFYRFADDGNACFDRVNGYQPTGRNLDFYAEGSMIPLVEVMSAPQNDESKNVARIECSMAPDGWRLVPIHPTQEMRASAGRAESNYTANQKTFFAGDAWAPMVANAPKYVADEWQGEGPPPVGVACEVTPHNDVWGFSTMETRPCSVIAYHADFAWIYLGGPGVPVATRIDKVDFTPIRTPEQIAAEEIEAILNWMVNRDSERGLRGIAEDLHAHGYRKP